MFPGWRLGGRPRLASVDTAVLSSARSILAGRGYRGMSVEEVAVLAGVSKPTIYRRYPSKRDLARAAVEGLSDGLVGAPRFMTVMSFEF